MAETEKDAIRYHEGVVFGIKHPGAGPIGCPYCIDTLRLPVPPGPQGVTDEAEKDARCWCGGQRGSRVPADADGWGCLDDINHAQRDEKDTLIVALAVALAFYAEPETYHAIFIVPDRPCGAFADDFSEDHGDPFYERPMPGARARAVLHEHAEVLLPLLPEEGESDD